MKCLVKNYKHYTIACSTVILFFTAGLFFGVSFKAYADDPTENEWVVVIDAGHGGKDPGAEGRLSKEKDITLAIALKTGKYIEDLIDGVKVIYTRKDDEFVELYRRAEIANKAKADLFISIHCNGFRDSRIKGSETFVMGIHKDQGNLEVAMKENSVITLEEDYTTRYQGYDPNSSESYIIFSLMQNIYLEQSLNFANYIQDQFRNRVGRADRGVKQAGFYVMRGARMPAILVEVAFLSNKKEERMLNQDSFQNKVVDAICDSIASYREWLTRR